MFTPYSIIIILFIIAGFITVIWMGKKISAKNRRLSWPSVEASIEHVDNPKNPDQAPDIYFTFEANGQNIKQKIEPKPGEETMPDFAKHFTSQYPKGSKMTVFYQPDAPENAHFSVGASTEDKLIFAIGIGAILLGLYAITV